MVNQKSTTKIYKILKINLTLYDVVLSRGGMAKTRLIRDTLTFVHLYLDAASLSKASGEYDKILKQKSHRTFEN